MEKHDIEKSNKGPEKRNYQSFFESHKFKDFLEYRQIKPEDIELAKELFEIDIKHPSEASMVIFGIMHNFFQFARKESAERLRLKISDEKSEIKKRMYEILLHFTEKYDYYTANQLSRLLEDISWMELKS